MAPKLPLTKIVHDALLDPSVYHGECAWYAGPPASTKTELFEFAESRMGYTGPVADLFNTADAFAEKGESFKKSVVDKLKRKQGIYD